MLNPNKIRDLKILLWAEVTIEECVNTNFMSFLLEHSCGSPGRFGTSTTMKSTTSTDVPPIPSKSKIIDEKIDFESNGICTRDTGGPVVINNMLVGIAFYHDTSESGMGLVSKK